MSSLSLESEIQELEVHFGSLVAALTLDAVEALFAHGFDICIIAVCFPFLEELATVVLSDVEVVAGVAELCPGDAEGFEVGQNGVFVLGLFLAGIGVVKPDEHLAFIEFGVVVIERGGLDVADVQISRGLRRESGADFAYKIIAKITHFGSLEHFMRNLRLLSVLLLDHNIFKIIFKQIFHSLTLT